MDEAALGCGGRARGDCVVGATSAVDDGDQCCEDAFHEPAVVVGGFVCAPVPGDDVGGSGGDDEASAGGVCDVRAGFGPGGSAGCASLAGGAFAGCSVAFHLCAAVAAWSILGHWNTTSSL